MRIDDPQQLFCVRLAMKVFAAGQHSPRLLVPSMSRGLNRSGVSFVASGRLLVGGSRG